MIPTNEIIMLIGAINTAAIAFISVYFKLKHEENKGRLDNLCESCEYEYTPIKEKNNLPNAG